MRVGGKTGHGLLFKPNSGTGIKDPVRYRRQIVNHHSFKEEDEMRHFRNSIFVLIMLTFGGCAWQRIPAAPEYSAPAPLPIRLGVVLADTQPTGIYGPGIIGLWKEMGLFEAISYPYREGDQVDGVLTLTIDGGWKGQGAGAGFVIGLTFGLASAAVGPSMTGTHDAVAALKKGTSEIARYSARVESTVEWGMGANTSEVAKKADDLQRRKLAVEIARTLEADRVRLAQLFGK